METPTIKYKSEDRELKITNSTMMRFSRLGGDIQKLEGDPVAQAITLACAALNLAGDPIDHADDFPPIGQLADAISSAMLIYNGGQPGEKIGEGQPPLPKSAMG